jgi:hypothetical protein
VTSHSGEHEHLRFASLLAPSDIVASKATEFDPFNPQNATPYEAARVREELVTSGIHHTTKRDQEDAICIAANNAQMEWEDHLDPFTGLPQFWEVDATGSPSEDGIQTPRFAQYDH